MENVPFGIVVAVVVALAVIRWLSTRPSPRRVEIVAAATTGEAYSWIVNHGDPAVHYQYWNVNDPDAVILRGHLCPVVHVVGSLALTFDVDDYPALKASDPFIERHALR